MKIHEIFKKIEHAAGMTDKTVIMQQNLNDIIKQIYLDCYDPQVKYGVHKFEINNAGAKTIDDNYSDFHNMLQKLASKELTGNVAIDAVVSCIESFVKEDQELLKSILNKKLTIGFSFTSFKKLTGLTGSKPFEVALACHLESVKDVDPVDGTWYASRKLDGCRCIAKIDKRDNIVSINFISRQGKYFTTLSNIIPALQWLVRNENDGVYYADGECCIVDNNGNEDFQSVLKEIRRKDWTIINPCYQLFDFVTEDEFLGKTKSANFDKRYQHMLDMIEGNKFKTLKVLKQEVLHSQEDFDRWSGYVAAGNWEGFMLRKNEEFKTGRLKTLLKVKLFCDDEFTVKDIEISEMTTAEPGKGNVKYTGVKSLIIEYKGCKVNVGSGLSKEQRKDWYVHPEHVIGKTITVKYFEPTRDQSGSWSLRFPVLKAVYDSKRDL